MPSLKVPFTARMKSASDELQQQVKIPDRRYGGFADADGADFVGLDEIDLQLAAKGLGQSCCGHPPGGTAADDGHAINSVRS
jgi:hypothetical protein